MKKIFGTKKIYRKVFLAFIFSLIIVTTVYIAKLVILNNSNKTNPNFTTGDLNITMIDVGNGDSMLALQNDSAMLIDTGYFYTYSNVKETLEANNVEKIDYLIITHPHRDHIGGFLKLIFDYRIDNIIILEENIPASMNNSEKYYYFLEKAALKVERLFKSNVIIAKNDDGSFNDFDFENSYVRFLGPVSDNYTKLNNYSLVFKMEFNGKSILFTGDMEKTAEEDLIRSSIDLSANILKVGHHGSKTSSTEAFLTEVNPEYAIVSADNGNRNLYGHPGIKIVTYMKEHDISLYRTDETGNIVFNIEAETGEIEFEDKPGDYLSGTQRVNQIQKQTKLVTRGLICQN